jgi:hypothetical protein
MLKAQEDGEKNGNFIVEAVERSLVILVFAVKRPDVGGDEVEIIL